MSGHTVSTINSLRRSITSGGHVVGMVAQAGLSWRAITTGGRVLGSFEGEALAVAAVLRAHHGDVVDRGRS